MENKRQQARYKLTLLDTHTKLLFADHVSILDMSLSGVSLRADRRMNMGCNYLITIRDEERFLNIKCRVVWSLLSGSKKSTRGESIPIYTAGLNFPDISTDRQREIKDFVERHRVTEYKEEIDETLDLYVSNYMPLNICIKNTEDYTLNDKFYRAKKLSPTGLQIECRKVIETECKLNMEITFPEGVSINVKGCVGSCCGIRDNGSEHYRIGIEFVDMHEKERELLKSFILFHKPTNR